MMTAASILSPSPHGTMGFIWTIQSNATEPIALDELRELATGES